MFKLRLAVIEDNPDNRLLVRALLEDRYEIVEYEDGIKALEQMPQMPPDAVLLDISLPMMSGVEVLQKMREQALFQKTPVIALTAHAMSGDRETYLAHGFDGYLAKPIWDDQILCDLINELVEKKKAEA